MSTTVAGFHALPAALVTERRVRPVLAALVREVFARVARTDRGEIAELAPHLRADIGLPPAASRPQLRASALVGW